MNEKEVIIARLLNNESTEALAKEFNLSVALIDEWKASLPKNTVETNIKTIAIQESVKTLSKEFKNNKDFKSKIGLVANEIVDTLAENILDFEIAKVLNVQTNTIVNLAKLTNTNNEESEAELLTNFRHNLKL